MIVHRFRLFIFVSAALLLAMASGPLATVAMAANSIAADATSADLTGAFASRLPATTRFAAFSSDVGQTCEAFQKTRLGETLCGPDFKPLIGELIRLNLGSCLRLRPEYGFDWNDLATVHDAGGLVVFPLADGKLGSAWLFLAAKPGHATPACLTAATAYFKQQGFRESTVKRPTGIVTIWQPPASRKTDAPRASFVAKEFYGVATSQAAAEAMLAVTAEKSLAADAAFIKLLPSLSTGKAAASDVRFYLEPLGLAELVQESETPAAQPDAAGGKAKNAPAAKTEKGAKKTKADSQAKKEPKGKKNAKDKKSDAKQDSVAAAKRLGWDGLQAIAGTLSFQAAAPCEWELHATLLAPQPYRGAMRMLELAAGPATEMPAWVRGDSVSFAAWQWNFAKAMKGFGNLFDEANEPGPDGEGLFEDMLDGLRDDAEGVQVDLRRDVFAHLGPNVFRVVDGREPAGAEESRERPWLIGTDVKNAKAVLAALTRFYKGDKRVQHAAVGQYDLWTVGDGASLFVEGEGDSVVNVRALALGQGQLLFGTDVELLKGALAAPAGAALRSDPGWMRLRDWIKRLENDKTAMRSFARLDQVFEPSYRAAASGKASESEDAMAGLWRLLLYGNSKGIEGLPASVTPKFDVLRAALPPAAMTLSQTADGWALRVGVLAPVSNTTP